MSTAVENDPACEVPGDSDVLQKASDLHDPVLKKELELVEELARHASAISKFNALWNKKGATGDDRDDRMITAAGAVPEFGRKLLFFCGALAPPPSWPLWE